MLSILFWYKVFVHWKLKLLNFLVDSILILWGLSHIPTPQSSFIRDDFYGAKRTSAWEATGSLIKLNAFQIKGKFYLNLEILETFSVGLEVSFWGDFCTSEPQILFCFVFFADRSQSLEFWGFFLISIWSSGVKFFRVHGYILLNWAIVD